MVCWKAGRIQTELNRKEGSILKILFFDIDGTLMDRQNRIPESTVRGLRLVREKGNLCLLCTGRTCSMVPEQVEAIGFDGIVGGGGTYIRVKDRVLMDRELTLEEVKESLPRLMKGRFGFLYEGKDCLHVMPWEHYENPEWYKKHILHIGASYEVIDPSRPEQIHTAKFSGTLLPHQWAYCQEMAEKLSGFFHMIVHQAPALDGSSRAATEGFVEFLPNGCNKAAGIKQVLSYLGLPLEAAYAFGDSNNDLEMLRLVPHSICMGNGTEAARQAAEHITADLNEDGIWKALEYYHLTEG